MSISLSNISSHEALAQHYQAEGLSDEAWHVGPEHPALEQAALEILETMGDRRVIEIGFQAGGFAIPIICALHGDPRFRYVGVDNLAYRNSVRPDAIKRFLQPRVTPGCYEFIQNNSTTFLKTLVPASVDLMLLDHFKPLYERDLLAVCRRGIVRPGGAILLHDVHAGAAHAWHNCQHIIRTFELEVKIRSDVPAGLAILRTPSAKVRQGITIIRSSVITASRAAINDTILHARRVVGHGLRRAGVRT